MAIFLTYLFVKGPLWLRTLALLAVAGLLLFGCLTAVSTFSNAIERPVPPHAHPTRTR